MGMEAFYTRDKANEGRKLTLYTPDGQPTDEWLLVRHVWSDAFKEAEEAEIRGVRDALLSLGEDADPADVAKVKRDSTNRLLASLIAGWSFETELTPEAATAFLAQAPQIADKINSFAAESKGFFGNESRNSKRGSKQKSG